MFPANTTEYCFPKLLKNRGLIQIKFKKKLEVFENLKLHINFI